MKYLVSYLREYAHKHQFTLKDTHCIDSKIVIDEFGTETTVFIDEVILFNEAADRIEFLERKLKELEEIEKIVRVSQAMVSSK